jgi:hypothetical protein
MEERNLLKSGHVKDKENIEVIILKWIIGNYIVRL